MVLTFDVAQEALKAPCWLPYTFAIYRAAALSCCFILLIRWSRKNCKLLWYSLLHWCLENKEKTLADLFSVQKSPPRDTLQDIIDRWLTRGQRF